MRFIAPLAAALALLATAAFASDIPPTSSRVRVGDQAPAFSLELLNGEGEICVGETKGCNDRIKILVFWSFFCFPCQDEMPSLQKFHEENKDTVDVIGIGLDGHEYDNFVMPFIKKHKLTLPLTYDRSTVDFFEVAEKYGVVGTPTFFVIDLQNRIRFMQLGRIEPDIMAKIVESAKTQSFCADIVRLPKGATPKIQNAPEGQEQPKP
ncbi:TlpA family protein disulfide reductase [bacterium]|nr:MAG: TlpA family protein disulfide reductase [bacterium]